MNRSRLRETSAVIAGVTAFVLVLSGPVAAGTLVVAAESPICRSIAELKDIEARLAAQDKDGADLYLHGAQPPCLLLGKGEVVEQLDRAGSHLQVVTRRGVPRFIGWGEQHSFRTQ